MFMDSVGDGTEGKPIGVGAGTVLSGMETRRSQAFGDRVCEEAREPHAHQNVPTRCSPKWNRNVKTTPKHFPGNLSILLATGLARTKRLTSPHSTRPIQYNRNLPHHPPPRDRRVPQPLVAGSRWCLNFAHQTSARRLRCCCGKSSRCRSITHFPSTSASISVRRKQEIASAGVRTTGSFSFSDVFNTIGTPVF